jgi:ketosteroid isomerase-like protein
VTKALAAWASAWSRKDMKAYLGAYASDFKTPGGMNRKAWEKEREQRIGARPGKISVTYDEPSITINDDRATVRFRQHYKAPGISTSSTKTLLFGRTGNKWLIKEENAR